MSSTLSSFAQEVLLTHRWASSPHVTDEGLVACVAASMFVICFRLYGSRIIGFDMPGFGDSAFIILLALLLFGPKKLPVLARQLGKLMGDFRRASNEFRMQMEEELRISEQADRQKQIAALEASAPHSPPAGLTDAHKPPDPPTFAAPEDTRDSNPDFDSMDENSIAPPAAAAPIAAEPGDEPAAAPIPIATSGDLAMMPPSTGLPVAKAPAASSVSTEAELETQTLHG